MSSVSMPMPKRIRVGSVIVEPMRNRITAGRNSRRVTKREMDVLMRLVEAKSAVATREELLQSVWSDVVVNDDALTLAISRLRQALGDDPRNPEYIETIPTRGYRLLVPTGPADDKTPELRARKLRRYKVGIALLVLLLTMVTAMFMRVRSEYMKVSEDAPSSETGINQTAR